MKIPYKLMTMEYDSGDEVKSNLQSAFTKLMTASKHMVSEAIAKLINRLNAESKVNILVSYNVCVHICIKKKLIMENYIYFVIASCSLLANLRFPSWSLLILTK